MTKAVVVANGQTAEADRRHLDGAAVIVAADGGALTLARWGVLPHVLVGDLDSVDAGTVARLAAAGVALERHPTAKDETDLEVALERALAGDPTEIVILGAFGGERLDLTIANALLLADPRYRGRGLRAVLGATTARVVHGGERLALAGHPGQAVSLLPLGTVHGVTTEGLRFPLRDEVLPLGRARGVSNVVETAPAAVRCEQGVLLVIERSL